MHLDEIAIARDAGNSDLPGDIFLIDAHHTDRIRALLQARPVATAVAQLIKVTCAAIKRARVATERATTRDSTMAQVTIWRERPERIEQSKDCRVY
jgi:hypothetical protein